MASACVSLPGPFARPQGIPSNAASRYICSNPVIGSKARIKNASGVAGLLSNHVQTLVHSIDEIDVSASGRTENDARPFRHPAVRVGRLILRPEIRLYLDNHSGATMVDQNATEQAFGNVHGRPRIEREWQRTRSVNQFGQWPGIRTLDFGLVYNQAVFRILYQSLRVEQTLQYRAGRNAPIHRNRLI